MDSTISSTTTSGRCPAWCGVTHGQLTGEEDLVHLSGELLVRDTLLRLCADGDSAHGPYVLVGHDEFSLHEAEALIAALTQLVDQGSESVSRAGA